MSHIFGTFDEQRISEMRAHDAQLTAELEDMKAKNADRLAAIESAATARRSANYAVAAAEHNEIIAATRTEGVQPWTLAAVAVGSGESYQGDLVRRVATTGRKPAGRAVVLADVRPVDLGAAAETAREAEAAEEAAEALVTATDLGESIFGTPSVASPAVDDEIVEE